MPKIKDRVKVDEVIEKYIPSMFKRRELYAKLADLNLKNDDINELFSELHNSLLPHRR